MAYTVTEKIILRHLADKGALLERGAPIMLVIDQTLTQDATGTMAYLQFESLGLARVKTELSVSYIDHNTLQEDYKNQDDHRYLQSAAAKYGLWFSRAGNGICHQVHLERFGIPGKTLLGSDSHTPTAGGLGMLAIGAGGLDVAAAMGGSPFNLVMPKIYGVRLLGKLRNTVSAKDIILELLRRETVKGGVGVVYEYFGEGVSSLTVPQRATITNMGAELGATSSLFPSDEMTLIFLEERGRASQWTELHADSEATYDKIIEIDLSKIEPLAACPHSPDAVEPVSKLKGIVVDQVIVGSCTNSSLDDLAIVAEIVKGKRIHTRVSAAIACGSRITLMAADKAGVLGELLRAGFRLLENVCGPCIGMGCAPKSAGVSLRTFNRNFKGRSGTGDAAVYLVSPETAAQSAVTGSIQAANSVLSYRNLNNFITESAQYADEMLIAPLSDEESQKIELEYGPNIKPCPMSKPPADVMVLPILFKGGDNITTDDIMPAGAKVLPLRSNIPEIAKYVLHNLAPDFYEKAIKAQGCIIIGGMNYGQGSSREHAALAPMYLGVKAVIAKSFARIHKANLINYGILPFVFADADAYDMVHETEILEMNELHKFLAVLNKQNFIITNKTCGKKIRVKLEINEREREILCAGGTIPWIKQVRLDQKKVII
jgi:aconitate hydratase